MKTFVINIPAQNSAPTSQSLLTRNCSFLRLGKQNTLEFQGSISLSELGKTINSTDLVILLLATVDVTLLRINVPPLSNTKLRIALPNLVEEKLLQDTNDCVISCSAKSESGLRTVAVARRAWVELLLQTLYDLGAQRISILPSQTSLPLIQGKCSASLQDQDSTLCVRLSEHEGMGLSLNPAAGLLSTLRTLIPTTPLVLFLNPEQQHKYATELAADNGITIQTLNGTHFQMPDQSLDLATGVAMGHQNTWDLRPWRWPLMLSAALLLTQTLALNLDWWHLSREARDLRTSMTQIYLSAYPKETVILDPLLQMQQKIATTRREAGLSSPDDFNSLVAELGTAWSNTPPPTSITAIEYHDHKLNVTLKDKVSIETIKAQLAQRSVTLEISPDADHAWIIGSKR